MAGDEETYDVFADLFDPIIEGRHNVSVQQMKHATSTFNLEKITDRSMDPHYVISCRVCHGFCLCYSCYSACVICVVRKNLVLTSNTHWAATIAVIGRLCKLHTYAFSILDSNRHLSWLDRHLPCDSTVICRVTGVVCNFRFERAGISEAFLYPRIVPAAKEEM